MLLCVLACRHSSVVVVVVGFGRSVVVVVIGRVFVFSCTGIPFELLDLQQDQVAGAGMSWDNYLFGGISPNFSCTAFPGGVSPTHAQRSQQLDSKHILHNL